MDVYNQMYTLGFLLICFGFYKFLGMKMENSKKKDPLLVDDLMPYIKNIDVENEKKIRAQWLISFLSYLAISLIIEFTRCLEIRFSEFTENTVLSFNFISGSFISSICNPVILFWITYHCSYKKRGTSWLMLMLIWIPAGLLLAVGTMYWNQLSLWNSLDTVLGKGWPLVLAALSTSIFFWFNCLRLYRANSVRKHEEELAMIEIRL